MSSAWISLSQVWPRRALRPPARRALTCVQLWFLKPGAVAQDSRHRVATRREPALTEHLLQLWLGSLSWLLLQLGNLGKEFSILFFYLFSKFQIISNSKRQTAQKGKSHLACEGGERVCPGKCSQHPRPHTRSQHRVREKEGQIKWSVCRVSKALA